ncbi:GNAT family N-acetyltransferase [Roseateles amylovorans]|jgi:GNAT superfamily N-acetyltransferase|uniref:GNAT family N-acetyltransferase n=1 Tax=Roseateles amylovorans TaxID=2978473 RepID=A0ABY6AZ60_9BURK|nr:GNAT family N-acetyltransferase [Roseateles amylovorans]UXH78464.1 GNAT family N-acetyltransferase [Roseateles amylovorans]
MTAPQEWRRDGAVPQADLDLIRDRVITHGRQQAQGSDAADIAVALYEHGELVAGAFGRTEFQRLYISYLWVADERRGQGLGGDCLRQIEALALRRGCVDVLVETLLDEVAELYEHLGYACISHVHDFVPGFTRHTLLKVWQSRD